MKWSYTIGLGACSAPQERPNITQGCSSLSRRDGMKVARHEMPGKWADMIRPVGNGVIRGGGLCSPPKAIRHPRRPIIPYPTGRASRCGVSRHFMPGYRHVVPSGQKIYELQPNLSTPSLHAQDSRTRTSTTGAVRLTEPLCTGQLQNQGN
jgi:hypothetical protein